MRHRTDIREKKHRLPRGAYRGQVVVAVTACIADRKPLFEDAVVVEAFRGFLARSCEKHDCAVLIYCYMPEHEHLLIQGRSAESDVWRALVDYRQLAGFWLRRSRPGFDLQKDFYDHVIRGNEDLAAQARYLADNPVRRKLVQHWRQYPFTGSIGFDLNELLIDAAPI